MHPLNPPLARTIVVTLLPSLLTHTLLLTVHAGALSASLGPTAHTPGGSVVQRTAQPITFSDFCQIVDMQFLTHIRRGTSISVCDFAPSSLPQDLNKALELLSVTSECDI